MRIKRFNEIVGFDDEETRDRLEIPNLRGEFDSSSPTMKTIFLPSDKINTQTEVKKILFRYPILEGFHEDKKRIEGSILSSFYATSKIPVDGNDFYAQLSFAYHQGGYYIGTILREREDMNEEKWVTHSFTFDNIDDVYKIVDAFLKACKRLGIVDDEDLRQFLPEQN